jgi:acetoin:2,6-dichlorophenolindophenol oxidoreductase subunit beta
MFRTPARIDTSSIDTGSSARISFGCTASAWAAAEELGEYRIDAEVIDLRTLRPIDHSTVHASLAKTNRLVVVEEGPLTGGWAAELVARASELALHDIDDIWRVTTPDHPIPYSPSLEDAFLPGVDAIVASVAGRFGTETRADGD